MASIASQVQSQALPPAQDQQATSSLPDPFHGHEQIARLAARFVLHLFACPDQPAPASGQRGPVRFDHFIAHALHRTRSPESVTYASLFLLQRLKARFPHATGSSGHRLFISAFMLASKTLCDDTYTNKTWCVVAQDIFALREINSMERELCWHLNWQLDIYEDVLADFTARVASDFSEGLPCPTLGIPFEASPATGGSNVAAFGQGGIHTSAPAAESPRRPEGKMSTSSPPIPGTPSSGSVSPASIAAPRTPTDSVPSWHLDARGGRNVRHHARSHPEPEPEHSRPLTQEPYLAAEEAGDRANAILGAPGSRKHVPSLNMGSKAQIGHDMFAYATTTVW